jgi:transglutaminase-like putative cysteine protease
VGSLAWLARGQENGKPLEEFHEVVQVAGARAGFVHHTVHRHDTRGKLLRASSVLNLTLRRYGSLVRVRKEEGTIETPSGRVVGVFLRQGQVGGRQLVLTGVVEDDKLRVKVDGGRIERRLSWNAEALGSRGQERLFGARKPKPGERFSFRRYEPVYNAVLTVRVEVKGRETVDVLGAKKSLLRVELKPDKLEAPGQTVSPAKAVWWLDEDFVPVRRQVELDGVGTLLLTRTTRDKALLPATPATDVGARSLVRLDRGISRPYETRSIVYKVTVRGEEAGSLLANDSHQEVRHSKGDTFELHVHPVRPGAGVGEPSKAGAEYLASCHFIDHDNARVKELARKAAAQEKDAWKKAVRIERWVKAAMRNDNAADLAPASTVARTLRGDCRHHALLTAALCRAEGIPSRTAVGLLYVYKGGPALGFHMWAEVHVEGRWLGLDSTLGKGGVSAAHVKITDHGWNGVQSLTPLLPASRVLGKLRVQVVRVEK